MDHQTEENRDPIVVFQCKGDAEAEIVRALLESYGIPCSIRSGIGEVRLAVPVAAAVEAMEILRAHSSVRQVPLRLVEPLSPEELSDAEPETGGGRRS
jgi:hypothetical protein